jgi:hypothetical protein
MKTGARKDIHSNGLVTMPNYQDPLVGKYVGAVSQFDWVSQLVIKLPDNSRAGATCLSRSLSMAAQVIAAF